MTEAITIDGLTQFSKALKQIDSELPKMLKLVFTSVSDVVITAARPKLPTKSGRAAASIKSTPRADSVRVSAGGKKAPWYPWIDYGGEGRKRGRPPKRPFVKQGRYLYPTYFEKRDSGELSLIMTNGLFDVVRAAGVEVD